jgi:ABC-type transport system substrate-binding protein
VAHGFLGRAQARNNILLKIHKYAKFHDGAPVTAKD